MGPVPPVLVVNGPSRAVYEVWKVALAFALIDWALESVCMHAPRTKTMTATATARRWHADRGPGDRGHADRGPGDRGHAEGRTRRPAFGWRLGLNKFIVMVKASLTVVRC